MSESPEYGEAPPLYSSLVPAVDKAPPNANNVPHLPGPVTGYRLPAINRPPLERASSVPSSVEATGVDGEVWTADGTSAIQSPHTGQQASGGHTDKPRISSDKPATVPDKAASKDAQPAAQFVLEETTDTYYHGERRSPSEQSLDRSAARRVFSDYSRNHVSDVMPVDENNVPQIDQVITPPVSPSRTGLGMISATSLKGLRHKLPSLKFKGGRLGSLRLHDRGKDANNTATSPTSANPLNPTITVTVNDDADSVISDYLNPEKNYRRDKVYIGDDVSLYGTPKEELSPLREPDNMGPKTANAAVSATNYLKDQIISFFQPSDNKLAMKLFGNKNALMKEKMRQKAAGNWVIHPCSNFR